MSDAIEYCQSCETNVMCHMEMKCMKSALSDLRTRAGRRKEILDQVRENEGFSIFWVTENPLRAKVAMEMQNSGEIETWNNPRGFPWINAIISEPNVQSTKNP